MSLSLLAFTIFCSPRSFCKIFRFCRKRLLISLMAVSCSLFRRLLYALRHESSQNRLSERPLIGFSHSKQTLFSIIYPFVNGYNRFYSNTTVYCPTIISTRLHLCFSKSRNRFCLMVKFNNFSRIIYFYESFSKSSPIDLTFRSRCRDQNHRSGYESIYIEFGNQRTGEAREWGMERQHPMAPMCGVG